MGRGAEHAPAHQAAQQGVGGGEVHREIDQPELARGARRTESGAGTAGQLPGDEQRGHPTGHVYRELDHIRPDHGLEPAEPGVDQRHEAHRDDRGGDVPPGHQGQRDRPGEDPDPVAQEPGDEEERGDQPPGRDAEAGLQPGIRGLLLAGEVTGQEPSGHGDAPEEVAEGELEEGQVAARADPGHRDDGERARLRGHDREQDRRGREVARAEEVVAGGALAPAGPHPDGHHHRGVGGDDREVEGTQLR